MVFEVSYEQRALREAVRSFAADAATEPEIRRIMDLPEGYDRGHWTAMASGLGLQGIVVPEEFGGSGAGLHELAIVLEELGRRLFPGPFLSTALASLALTSGGDKELCAEVLPGIADGSAIATLAVAEVPGLWDADGVACRAYEESGRWLLSGEKHYVPDAQVADVMVVAARTEHGVALFAVDAHAPEVEVSPLETLDLIRRLGRVTFDRAAARPLGEVRQGSALFETVLDLVRVLVSAEQVGGAQAALDMAVDYAKARVQFGRAIGSFQAVKHMCADGLLEVESARSAAYYGVHASGSSELRTVAPLAKAYCSDAFVAVASMNMQVHGGMSFTWEHPAHLYLRRAESAAHLWGSPDAHRELLATRLLADESSDQKGEAR